MVNGAVRGSCRKANAQVLEYDATARDPDDDHMHIGVGGFCQGLITIDGAAHGSLRCLLHFKLLSNMDADRSKQGRIRPSVRLDAGAMHRALAWVETPRTPGIGTRYDQVTRRHDYGVNGTWGTRWDHNIFTLPTRIDITLP